MEQYWQGIIGIIFLSLLRKEAAYLYIPFFAYCLLWLPDTGRDYIHYQLDYYSGTYHQDWPFYRSSAGLTAEPLYRSYTAVVYVITKMSFQHFLSANFLISMGLIAIGWKKFFNHFKFFPIFILFFSIVAAPTIFYFSPRSSISFATVFLTLGLLKQHKILWAILSAFVSINIHSQYIVAVIMLFLVYGINRVMNVRKFNPKFLGGIIGGAVFIGLVLSELILPYFIRVFSFLPSIDVFVAKTHILTETSRTGSRLASLLSLTLYPGLLILSNNANLIKSDIINRTQILFISAITFTNAAIILWAFNDPHLSGRLARFTDYTSFSILMPLFLIGFTNHYVTTLACLLLAIISPQIFTGLYNF